MTRQEAKDTVYKIINSGIINSELEEELQGVANGICEGFEECDNPSEYCEGCKFCKE